MDPLADLRWRTSTHSGSNGGGCLETASRRHSILIRDTRDRTGPVLQFTPAAWRRFTSQIKDRRA